MKVALWFGLLIAAVGIGVVKCSENVSFISGYSGKR